MLSYEYLKCYGEHHIKLPDRRRVQIYVDPAAEMPIHRHWNDLRSTVLLGEIHEFQYDDDGNMFFERRIKAGETYDIDGKIFHRIEVVCPTITIVTEVRKIRWPLGSSMQPKFKNKK